MKREFCEVCARKYMRQLWLGNCVCDGSVKLTGSPPGGHLPHHEWVAKPKKKGKG